MITYCWNEQCLSWRHGHQTTGQNNLSCSHMLKQTMTLLGTRSSDKKTRQLVMITYCWNNDSLGDMVIRQGDRTTCHVHILLKQTMTLLGTRTSDKGTEQLVMFTYCWNKQWLSWGHGHQTRGQNNLSRSHSNSLSTTSHNVTMTFWVEMKSSDKWTGYNNLSCSHSNCLLTLSLSDLLGGDEVIGQVDRV